tara:strand:- start:97 stop:273 length:177 start_codon:yes stop_codon:yes gene_type:complete
VQHLLQQLPLLPLQLLPLHQLPHLLVQRLHLLQVPLLLPQLKIVLMNFILAHNHLTQQ